jgi:hypothetical protein
LKAVFLTITAHAQKYQKYHFQYQNWPQIQIFRAKNLNMGEYCLKTAF